MLLYGAKVMPTNLKKRKIMFEISINNNTDWTDREGICLAEAAGQPTRLALLL